MPKDAVVHVRVESETKQQAEEVFNALGLSTSEAVNLFLKQVVLHKGLPFALRIPNEETIAAMREDWRTLRAYTDVDALMRDLARDDEE